MKKKESVIYEMRNMVNNKVYIGGTTSFRKRKSRHLISLRKGIHKNNFLQSDWNKFGEGAFQFKILESGLEKKEIHEHEELWIEKNNCLDSEFGYNIRKASDFRMHKNLKNCQTSNAKITNKQAKEIKRFVIDPLNSKLSIEDIIAKFSHFNVTESIIIGIRAGDTWGDINI